MGVASLMFFRVLFVTAAVAVWSTPALAQNIQDRNEMDVWVVTKDGVGVGYDTKEGNLAELVKVGGNKKYRASLLEKFGGDRSDPQRIRADQCGIVYKDQQGRYRVQQFQDTREDREAANRVIQGNKGEKLSEELCPAKQPDAKRDPEMPRLCMVTRYKDAPINEKYPRGASFKFYYYLKGWYADEDGYLRAAAVTPVLSVSASPESYSKASDYLSALAEKGRTQLNAAVAAKKPALRPSSSSNSKWSYEYHWDKSCVEAAREAAIRQTTWEKLSYPPLVRDPEHIAIDEFSYTETEGNATFGVAK